MANFRKILNIVSRILIGIALFATTVVSLALGYIVFAPDTFPKPFYLQYTYPTPTPTPEPGSPADIASQPTPTPTAEPLKPGEGLMVNTGAKIINLAEPGGRRYIRITIVLEFSPTDPAFSKMTAEEKNAYVTAFNDEIKGKQPIIDDAIITIISTKTFDQLYTADGKEALRHEILDQLRKSLPNYEILSIYFSEFVVE